MFSLSLFGFYLRKINKQLMCFIQNQCFEHTNLLSTQAINSVEMILNYAF